MLKPAPQLAEIETVQSAVIEGVGCKYEARTAPATGVVYVLVTCSAGHHEPVIEHEAQSLPGALQWIAADIEIDS